MASYNNNDAGSAEPRPLQMGAKGAYIVRLLMVGDSACGKTSLVLRFDQNVFSTKFVTTIGVDYRDKMVKVRRIFAEIRLEYMTRLYFSK
jgi:GTPase SAR1 family protein